MLELAASCAVIPLMDCKGVTFSSTSARLTTPDPRVSASWGARNKSVLEPVSSVSKKKKVLSSHWCKLPGMVPRILERVATTEAVKAESARRDRNIMMIDEVYILEK